MSRRLSVAIIGAGPKGLYALERLSAHATDHGAELDVTIFDPHPEPGAGPVYSSGQPDHLLMNFPADRIDAGWRGAGAPGPVLASFPEWAAGAAPRADRDRALTGSAEWYPPRALVGRYLAETFRRVVATAPFAPAHVRESVELVTAAADGEGWAVMSTGGYSHRFDEVLLTTGHPTGSLPPGGDGAESGSTVAVRGFGLTAIDLILNLTEGRGGSFEADRSGRLVYQPTGGEPARIRPWSRSGRTMAAKPGLGTARTSPGRSRAVERAVRGAGVEIGGSDGGLTALIAAQAELATALLSAADACADRAATRSTALAWLEDAITGALGPDRDPYGALERSLQISTGRTGPDLRWGLGAAWRESYPAIVERYSHGGLAERDRSAFLALSTELERLSFGPPPANAAKLLALADAGILDLGPLSTGEPGADHHIEAVIPGPGAAAASSPVGELIGSGALRVPAGLRGIEVGEDLTCIAADGSPSEGLAAAGRITEDWVIGNDSLSRTLHPHLDRWAERICAGAQSDLPPAVLSSAGAA